MSPNKNCAILDYDGTLSRLRHGWQTYMHEFFFRTAFPKGFDSSKASHVELECAQDLEEFIKHVAGTHYQTQLGALYSALEKLNSPHDSLEKITADYLQFNDQWVNKRLIQHRENKRLPQLLLADAEKMLFYLKEQGYDLFLLSGTGSKEIKYECQFLGIDHYFQDLIGFTEGAPEPFKPKAIENILSQGNYTASSSLVIGDGLTELKAGRENNCQCIAIAIDEELGFGIDPIKLELQQAHGFHTIVTELADFSTHLKKIQQLLK